MKTVLLAAAALIATPLMAQTTPAGSTPPATDQSTMTPPAAGQATTPPAADPAATATAPAPAATPMAAPDASTTTATTTTDTTAAAAALTGKLPWCRAGQFTGCRERSNAKGEGLRKN